jgi:hypothetical protein
VLRARAGHRVLIKLAKPTRQALHLEGRDHRAESTGCAVVVPAASVAVNGELEHAMLGARAADRVFSLVAELTRDALVLV